MSVLVVLQHHTTLHCTIVHPPVVWFTLSPPIKRDPLTGRRPEELILLSQIIARCPQLDVAFVRSKESTFLDVLNDSI